MAGTRDIEAGRAFVRVYLNDSALVKGLRNAGNHMRSFGASISGMGVKMTAMGGAMALPFIAAIKAASDMEETMNKFNVVFGSSATAVKAWSDDFAGSVGRSKQQAADFMASMQDLFVPLGFSADSAQDLSKQVTTLAVDLASFNNMADADTIRDLQAALTGSGEVMKKYGVIVSEAAVKLQLLKEGIDPKRATEQQKVQARLNIIMAGTTAAQGDAIRSAGAWANQMKKLWGVINDTAVVIGSALLPVVTPILTKAGELVTVFGAWAEKNQGLAVTIATVVAGVIAAGVALTALGGTIALMGFAIGGLASVLGAILSPLGLLVAGIVGGTAAFLKFTETGQAVADMLQGRFAELLGFVQGVMAGMSDAFAAGELGLAADIAMTGVKLAFFEATKGIRIKWIEFNKSLIGVLIATGKKVAEVFAAIRRSVAHLTAGFQTSVQEGDTNAALSDWDSRKGSMSKRDWMVGRAAILEEGAGALLRITNEADGKIGDIDEGLANWMTSLDEMGPLMEDNLDAQLKAGEDRLAALRAEMAKLRGDATTAAEAAKREKANAAAAAGTTPAAAAAGAAGGGLGSGAAAASFSSNALAALGQGGGPMAKLAKTADDHKKIAEKQLKKLDESTAALRSLEAAMIIT